MYIVIKLSELLEKMVTIEKNNVKYSSYEPPNDVEYYLYTKKNGTHKKISSFKSISSENDSSYESKVHYNK